MSAPRESWDDMRPRTKGLVVGAGVVLLVGLLTTVAAIASTMHIDDGIITTAECKRALKKTKAIVQAEAAKIVSDRSRIAYFADCDSLDPGGVSGPTTDSLADIRARMRALGDVKVHTNRECADARADAPADAPTDAPTDAPGKDDGTCRYLIYRPDGQDRTYIVRPVADSNDEFAIMLRWEQRDHSGRG